MKTIWGKEMNGELERLVYNKVMSMETMQFYQAMLFEDKLFTTIVFVFITCLFIVITNSNDDDEPPDISIWKK